MGKFMSSRESIAVVTGLCLVLLGACLPPLQVTGPAPAAPAGTDGRPAPSLVVLPMVSGAPTHVATADPQAQPAWAVTHVALDIFAGLPNPAWPLSADQDRDLRALLDPLAEAPCSALDLLLGYRGFVVTLGQRPELSNEYRLRIYRGEVRYGDPWSPDAPASCRADPSRQVERLLLTGARPHVDESLFGQLELALEQPAATLVK